ncbi:hypothetical protein HanRHA438_Chr10g0462861 [Helianthus annuus]|nr:hypothetical protein HanRHA438_Chr10g0462861 [Helianthus annuus]
MDEDFYNAFATPSTPITAIQTTMLENETRTMQKPPKLMSIEEFQHWEGRFENWVQANYLDAWECVETKYIRPMNDDEEPVPIKDLRADERKKYKNEKMMLSLLQQAVKEDIMVLLQHSGTSYSIWKALRSKFRGSEEMVKSKKSLLKLVAESDSEDEKVKKEKKKKKIKTPVSSDDEEVPVVRRQKMTEVPKFKVEEQVDAKEVPVKCENCEIVKKQNSMLINNLNRLKESYDVLNKAMNQYNQTSEEQAVAMKTLQGAFMTKQKIVNNYIEKCAALEQKLELQRIETERVNRLLKSYSCTSYVIDRIYPTVESMKVWEEDESTEEKAAEVSNGEKNADKKKSDRKKDTEKISSGKKKGVSYNRCPPPLENGYLPRHPNDERVKKATNLQWESESSVNLPESIDVVFTSSDTDQQSQLMKKVVDHVLDSDDSEESKSESASESKSESKAPSQTEKTGKIGL